MHWYTYLWYLAAGLETQKILPDFFVVKVIPVLQGLPRRHFIVAVVEVKRNEEVSESAAFNQAIDYFRRAWQMPLRDDELCGYIVMGHRVHRIRMEGHYVVTDEPFDMFEEGDQFTKELAKIAIRNWN